MSRALLVLALLFGSSTSGLPWSPAVGEVIGVVSFVGSQWGPNGGQADADAGSLWGPDGLQADTEAGGLWDPNG